MHDDQHILKDIFCSALTAVEPGSALSQYLPDLKEHKITVIGAGKASQAMAGVVAEHCDVLRGIVVVPHLREGIDCGSIEILEASHPIPDCRGQHAAKKILSLTEELGADDILVALISGGGSSLLPCPPSGLTLNDEIVLNEALLKSGAPISAMNAIRKQVSRIKGGRLSAAAYPARVITYVVSDVPGDDPSQVASGPTIADQKSVVEAMTFIERYRIKLPRQIIDHIEGGEDPAPLPAAVEMQNSRVHVIASASMALEAASRQARNWGLNPIILSDSIEGEAREVAKVIAAIAKKVEFSDQLVKKPAVILSGGETSVTVRQRGKGGRNTEFLLSLAIEIDGCKTISALAADTDGIDGYGGHAGALTDGQTCERIIAAGYDPAKLLVENNSYTAFEVAGSLLKTGATGTNVNDFRAVIVR